jgi:hypothetical protein
MAGLTNWDVRVVSAIDLSVKAYIPRWEGLEVQDQLSDVGSGRIQMDYNDPFFSDFEAEFSQSLLTGPWALQVLRNSTPVFTFLVEDVQVERTGFKQPVTISGRGIGAALEWGIVIPEGYSEANKINADSGVRPKFFDRLFKGYEYSVRAATTANIPDVSYKVGPNTNFPGSGATLTSNYARNINTGGLIDGMTDLIVGDNILVKNQTNSFYNGIYVISDTGETGTPFVLRRVAECDGSPSMDPDMVVGNQCYVSEGVTQNNTAWTLSTVPSSSYDVGFASVSFSPATQVYTGLSAFYCLFKEADTGVEYITDKGASFGTQRAGYGRGGSGRAVSWPLSLESTFNLAKGLTDSKGQIPKDGGSFTIPTGKSMLDVLRSICNQTQCDWKVSPTGEIKIVKKRGFDNEGNFIDTSPFGTDRRSGSNALLIPLAVSTSSSTRSTVKELKTVVYGSDKVGLDSRDATETIGIYGRREGYFENTSETAPAVRNITEVGLNTLARSTFELDPELTERPNMIAWLTFQVGDWVLVENAIGNNVPRVINGISVSVNNNGSETIQINFDEIIDSKIVSLDKVTGYGTKQARNLAVFAEQTNIKIPKVSTETIAASTEVSGLSNKVNISWVEPQTGKPASYAVHTYNVRDSTTDITGAVRENNIAKIYSPDVLTYFIFTGDTVRVSGIGEGFDTPISKVIDHLTGTYWLVGDDGPGLGKIYLVPSSVGNTTGQYYEALIIDSSTFPWQVSPYETVSVSGADGTAVGDGLQNTLDIIAQGGGSGSAAWYAREYEDVFVGKWHLPSRDELLLLLSSSVSSYLPFGTYWTSTEAGSSSAIAVDKVTGTATTMNKTALNRVVLVRGFIEEESYITYYNQGANTVASLTGSPKIEVFGEHKTITVPSTQTAVNVENLGSPGQTYYSSIVPINANGQFGEPSDPIEFVASEDDQIVTAGAIRSNTFTAGSAGWIIRANGTAQFNNNVEIYGTIYATGGRIGATSADPLNTGFTISSGQLTSGSGSNAIGISTGTYSFWAGNTTASSAPFRVTNSGALNVTSAQVGPLTLNSSGFNTFNSGFTNGSIQFDAFGDLYIYSRPGGGSRYYASYMLGEYFQARVTNSSYNLGLTGDIAGTFIGMFNPDITTDPVMIVNNKTPYTTAGGSYVAAYGNSGSIVATGDVNAGGLSIPSGSAGFGSTTRQMINLWSTNYGIGVQNSTQYFRTDSRFSWYVGGTHSNSENEPGGVGSRLATLTSGGFYSYNRVFAEGSSIYMGEWENDTNWMSVKGSNGYVLLGHGTAAFGAYFRTYTGPVHIGGSGNNTLVVTDVTYIGTNVNKTGIFCAMSDDMWFSDPQNGNIETKNYAQTDYGSMIGYFYSPSSIMYKKNIIAASTERLYSDMLNTTVYEFDYNQDTDEHVRAVGPIIEKSPEYFKRKHTDTGIINSAYTAMLHGAMQEMAKKITILEQKIGEINA